MPGEANTKATILERIVMEEDPEEQKIRNNMKYCH
jgi:hypothetical protein